ncbi:protein CLT2, chloroplastic-like [Salvia miltiorrhiza]|uniref:protein CLT2, chloroplastic-like n=1 Tax=Salvia miltiorrhiza TaxID=226208 RepID=UPI0025AC35DC|nr:protein CLT2, chloroplastic-like [Salvia miltiorrhiza]
MKPFIAGAKSPSRCLVSSSSSGGSNSGVSPTPSSRLHLPFHPSKPSIHKLQFSMFRSRSYTLYERKAIVPPSAILKVPWRDGSSSSSERKFAVVAWSVVTLLMAVANRVLQKLALVPMKDYPFFLAQLNCFALVVVFFWVLYVRYHVGVTTNEMLAVPKSPFVAIGFLEFLSSICGMYAGAMLPGPAIPLLYQTFLVWQLVFSSLLLGKRYYLNQIMGCFLVAAGVVVAVSSGGTDSGMLSGINPIWPGLMIASSFFQAGASIFKESVFIDAAKHLKGKSLDIFVLNSFASGFQALFSIGFLPILSNMKGIPLSQLPSYFTSGAACFFNIGTNTTGCEGAPLLPLLYIASNIFFNISILNLLKVSNAIVTSLAGRAAVPFAIYILSQPLPYLPKGVSLSPFFHVGSAILVVGLIIYNFTKREF